MTPWAPHECGSALNERASHGKVRQAGHPLRSWPRATSRCAHPHAGLAVLADLDTKFTDLAIRPRLPSVGLGGVRPPFGKIAQAACNPAETGARSSAFQGDRVADLRTEEFVGLAYGYQLDRELVNRAIGDAGSRRWGSIRRHVRPVNVHEFTGFEVARLAAA